MIHHNRTSLFVRYSLLALLTFTLVHLLLPTGAQAVEVRIQYDPNTTMGFSANIQSWSFAGYYWIGYLETCSDAGGEVPGYASTANLVPGVGYEFNVQWLNGRESCNGGKVVGLYVDDCYDLYINGVKDGEYSYSAGTTELSVQIMVLPKNVLFTYNVAKQGGRYVLEADGHSVAIPSTPDHDPDELTWAIEGVSLGCSIDQATGIVTASTNAGTILISATLTGVGCYEDTIDLVDPSLRCPCSSGCDVLVTNRSVDVSFELGWSVLGDSAGYLKIYSATPSPLLSSSQSLQYNFIRPDVEKLTNSIGIRQIMAPDRLVDVVTNTVFDYRLDFYAKTNAFVKAGSYYDVSGSSPISSILITNISDATNVLRVIETKDGSDTVYEYYWITNGWILEQGGGLRRQTKTYGFTEMETIKTVTNTVQHGTSTPTSVTLEKFYVDSGYGERLIEEVLGFGSLNLTNSFTYNDDGFPYESQWHDGTWEVIHYDSLNRPVARYTGFGNQAMTTNSSLCRLIDYDYDSSTVSGSGDDAYLDISKPRQTTEYLLGTEIKRNYFVALSGKRLEIACVDPGADWDDSSNLVTTNTLFTTGLHQHEVESVIAPNKTITIYQYSGYDTNLINIVLSREANSTWDDVVNGTKQVQILHRGRIVSDKLYDIASDPDITLQSEVYSYDIHDRATNVVHLDGSFTGYNYDCCTISSMVERDGSVTLYSYDALKRRTATSYNSIVTSNVFDASDRVIGTIRFGSDNSTMHLYLAAYDAAGRMLYSTNALDGYTSYSYAITSTGLSNTIVYPDGGTRRELYNLDGTLRQVDGTATHPFRMVYGTEQENSIYRAFVGILALDRAGTDTTEWTTNYFDGLGRNYRTERASASGPYPYSEKTYNSLGQVHSERDPDGVTVLYEYDSLGRQSTVSIAANQGTNAINYASDRIVKTVRDITTIGSDDVIRLLTYRWLTNGSSLSNLVQETRLSTDGHARWDINFNALTNLSTRLYVGSGEIIVTNHNPDGSYAVQTNTYGQLRGIVVKSPNGGTLGTSTYSYDEHGRLKYSYDARNGYTTTTFNDGDLVSSRTTPDPGTGDAPQTTSFSYDSLGRLESITRPDGMVESRSYLPSGELSSQYGARVFPVAYGYDSQGRITSMTNWTSFTTGSGERVTSWIYDGYQGFLTNKVYADNNGVQYNNSAAGRLQSRLWQRGITTYYTNNAFGDLAGIGYSDSITPNVTYTIDRAGRRIGTETTGSGAFTLASSYNHAGQPVLHSYTSGLLNGTVISNEFDGLFRRASLSWFTNSTQVLTNQYTYDAFSRYSNVVNGIHLANYSYVPNSSLVASILMKEDGNERLTRAFTYDKLERLSRISNSTNTTAFSSLKYVHNKVNQRVVRNESDGSRWLFQYDDLGQLTSGKHYWSDSTPIPGQQFSYTFDDIGNRLTVLAGGNEVGTDLRTETYGVNAVNQYTNRTVSGTTDIIGIANALSSVEVNEGATYRNGEYYQAAVTEDNSSTAVYPEYTVIAELDTVFSTNQGNLFIPKTPQSFSYDADGNLTNDGRWAFTWDADNRLTSLIALDGVPSGASNAVYYSYDDMGRRTSKVVSNWTGSAWSLYEDLRYVHDDWNIIAEVDADGAPVRTYTWGPDLSGSLHGAGGVGGLVCMTVYSGVNSGTYFYSYDGNGNVSALIDAADGVVTGNYEYTPFGGLVRATGDLARENKVRFSTKYYDDESEYSYYGHRYYNPSLGRWPNRDPIGEIGSMNLYAFVDNDPINAVDPIGLEELILKYDLSRDFWVPIGTKKVASLQELTSKVKKQVGPDDCVKNLRIGGHGRPGSFILDPEISPNLELSETTFRNYEKAIKNPELLALEDIQRDVAFIQTLKDLAKTIGGDASVEFISCETFKCSTGRALHSELEGIFGVGNVKGYAFPVKWGLNGDVYLITETKEFFGEDATVQKLRIPFRPQE